MGLDPRRAAGNIAPADRHVSENFAATTRDPDAGRFGRTRQDPSCAAPERRAASAPSCKDPDRSSNHLERSAYPRGSNHGAARAREPLAERGMAGCRRGAVAGRGRRAAAAPRGLGTAQWLWSGFEIELFRDEAEGYYLNLSSGAPVIFVMWRLEDDRGVPKIVTVSYNEAGECSTAANRWTMCRCLPTWRVGSRHLRTST